VLGIPEILLIKKDSQVAVHITANTKSQGIEEQRKKC